MNRAACMHNKKQHVCVNESTLARFHIWGSRKEVSQHRSAVLARRLVLGLYFYSPPFPPFTRVHDHV